MALRDLGQFFSHLNDIDFEYVVLRNWENLPFNVQVGPHSDLDLLVYDYDHFKEVFGDDIKEEHGLPRVQHRIKLANNEYVFCDVRYVGDNYYPIEFQVELLKTREFNSRGFWTPNPVFHRIGLAYHVAHHKGINKYQRHLGNLKPEELLEALKKSPVGWCPPEDPTVGRFNAYYSGATSHAEVLDNGIRKTQYRFKNHNLIKNEADILKKLVSDHFPKVLDATDTYFDMEDCGQPLNDHTLPDNWNKQLSKIVKELKIHGVEHRDIRLENLMVKDDIIKLIDFGWAKYKEDEDKTKLPDLLGFPNKAPWGFDDAYSMGKVIKQIKSWEDELCEY